MKRYVSQAQELADIAEAMKKVKPGTDTWKRLQAQLDRICGTSMKEEPDLFESLQDEEGHD